MKTDWLQDTTEDSKKDRRKLIMTHKPVLDILKTIMEKKLEALTTAQVSKNLYDSPNWAYMQADYAGAARVYKEMIDLLTIEEAQRNE